MRDYHWVVLTYIMPFVVFDFDMLAPLFFAVVRATVRRTRTKTPTMNWAVLLLVCSPWSPPLERWAFYLFVSVGVYFVFARLHPEGQSLFVGYSYSCILSHSFPSLFTITSPNITGKMCVLWHGWTGVVFSLRGRPEQRRYALFLLLFLWCLRIVLL